MEQVFDSNGLLSQDNQYLLGEAIKKGCQNQMLGDSTARAKEFSEVLKSGTNQEESWRVKRAKLVSFEEMKQQVEGGALG